jgi:hypothetical protein
MRTQRRRRRRRQRQTQRQRQRQRQRQGQTRRRTKVRNRVFGGSNKRERERASRSRAKERLSAKRGRAASRERLRNTLVDDSDVAFLQATLRSRRRGVINYLTSPSAPVRLLNRNTASPIIKNYSSEISTISIVVDSILSTLVVSYSAILSIMGHIVLGSRTLAKY